MHPRAYGNSVDWSSGWGRVARGGAPPIYSVHIINLAPFWSAELDGEGGAGEKKGLFFLSFLLRFSDSEAPGQETNWNKCHDKNGSVGGCNFVKNTSGGAIVPGKWNEMGRRFDIFGPTSR